MTKDGKYFKLSEFTCSCGCGANKTTPALMNLCEKIRAACGVPLRVNSGTRCPKHNKAVGGVANSNHVSGNAADLNPMGAITPLELHAIILREYKAGRLKDLAGLGLYDTFVHVDCFPFKKNLRQWDERKKK